jgi:hypothetical protein
MELSDIYTNRVNKTSITSISLNGNAPSFERDPIFSKLEKDVYSKLAEISSPEPSCNIPANKNIIKTFTFEDAIKDLANLKKNL